MEGHESRDMKTLAHSLHSLCIREWEGTMRVVWKRAKERDYQALTKQSLKCTDLSAAIEYHFIRYRSNVEAGCNGALMHSLEGLRAYHPAAVAFQLRRNGQLPRKGAIFQTPDIL